MKTKVIIKEQKTYNLEEIEKHVKSIFDELLEDKLQRIHTILIKPNLLGAFHPDKAVTTHPIVLEAVIKRLHDTGKSVIVGDSPGGTVAISKVWKETGIYDVCNKYNVPLIDLSKEGIVTIKTDVTDFYISETVMNCDAVINIAKLKTHSLMVYTGAVKNFYGVIPGLYKTELHKQYPNSNDFSYVLSKLYEIVNPKIALNIIDGIIGMDGAGPSAGKPYPYNVLIASEKASAADLVAVSMMNLDIKKLNYINQSLNVDNITESDIVVEDRWKNHRFKALNTQVVLFRNRIVDRLPSFMKNVMKAVLSYYPDFLPNCNLCLICLKACPVEAISKHHNKMLLNKKKCIKCLCCHEMCPSSAIYLKKNIFTKIVFKSEM